MSMLYSQYEQLYKKVQEYTLKIQELKAKLSNIEETTRNDIPKRIENLESKQKKIDEYLLKVRGFKKIAADCLDSGNLLTIEAPEGYRVNLNRLKDWAMKIDPRASERPEYRNDPYAQRLYAVASCDELFLTKKYEEFAKRIEDLKKLKESENGLILESMNKELKEESEAFTSFCKSEMVVNFLKQLADAHFHNYAGNVFEDIGENTETCAVPLGMYGVPFNCGSENNSIIKSIAGDCFDVERGYLYLPVEDINSKDDFVISVTCAPVANKMKETDAGLRNFILQLIGKKKKGETEIYVVDAVRQNTKLLGSLRVLEGSSVIHTIPRTAEQIQIQLEELVASFSDIDEIIENYDSVEEYNNTVDSSERLFKKIVILYGWPKAFDNDNDKLLKRIISNYERYGVSLILVTIKNVEKKENSESVLPEYLGENIPQVFVTKKETYYKLGSGQSTSFRWYSYNEQIPQNHIDMIWDIKSTRKRIGTKYTDRVNITEFPNYVKGEKNITVPYGVNSKDVVADLSFNNESFAAFLMGASGSGKSTLLHTIITGIIHNYHPDDVELWLADFKMSEFAQYMNPIPPHVKYILLDESKELVYDLLDLLTEKMMERQRFFIENKELKKVENVPKSVYMPIIFVILDEFSIMSQAIADSEQYRLKLQNLLAKGRALGIKFIFSSQTFTKGIQGLTSTAKDQIQTRIAMKNSYSEINETLEVSSNQRTEQVKNWMEALPPHYVLMKYRKGDEVFIQRLQVMYFDGKGDEALLPQRNLIDNLNSNMIPVTEKEYDQNDVKKYVEKNPVICDGNSYETFQSQEFKIYREAELQDSSKYAGDELLVSVGCPRLMKKIRTFAITPESMQNIALFGIGTDIKSGASIIKSVINSFKEQGQNVEVWAYERNRLYRTFRNNVWREETVLTDACDISEKITQLRSVIENQMENQNQLVIMIGLEGLVSDLDLIASQQKQVKASDIQIADKESTKPQEVDKERSEFEEFAKTRKRTIPKKIEEELNFVDDLNLDLDSMFKEIDMLQKDISSQSSNYEASTKWSEDLSYILQFGGRSGIHFMLAVNSYQDFKQTELKLNLFRHRLSLQITEDDSNSIFSSGKYASRLPEHVAVYSNMLEKFSFRPYIYKNITWDGFDVDDYGKVIAVSLEIK